ncbi:hypothetical protein ACOJEA_004794 [Klebsiella aerogenes]
MYTLINNNPHNFKISTDDMYVVLKPDESYVLVRPHTRLEINKHGYVQHDTENAIESLGASILRGFYDNGNEMTVELLELLLDLPKPGIKKKTKKG